MRRFLTGAAAMALLSAPVAMAQTLINFDVYPGPDGQLGTPDDIPIVAPTTFAAQPLQLTNEFATVGVRFAEPVVNDRNEILDNNTFTNPPGSTEPNLFAASGLLVIDLTFTVNVTSVSALIGISGGSDRMTIYDATNNVLGSAVGDDVVVTLASAMPIVRVTIVAETGTTAAIDNLEFSGGAVCYPDCDGDNLLTLADFGCFQTKFGLGDPYADCDGDTALTLADFGCFQTSFGLGCP
jgi:hypothetical protein